MRRKGGEKRRAERVTALLPVRAGRRKAVTRDVSASGLFFETDAGYSVGNKVRISLDLDTPWGKVMLRSDGKIVRVESHDHKLGVAVRFVDTKTVGGKKTKS